MSNTVRYTAYKTIVTREITRFMRIWPQTILPPAITMTLYFIIFGNLIGSRIGTMDGFSYMEFIVPGLIMMSVITSSYSNVVSSFFSMKFQHSIEEILIAPVPNYIILAGFVSGGVARGLLVGLIVSIISIIFTGLAISNYFITISVIVMTAILFSLAGMINAVFARNFDDISIIPTFVLTPLTYLGGVFYSIKLLPEFWQNVSLSNPILHMVNAFRYGVLGQSDLNITYAFIIIFGFIIVLASCTLYLLKKGFGIRS
ncbi:MAG: ABC transporter permease [Gammaproteobacteria bacterium]|nr:ABC transporter permease [Gammaproteobacteria bacterium]MDX2488233.1 ABC transporter permease [Gammaproteobacteria bacterium]